MAYRGIYDGLLALFTDYVPGTRHDESQTTLDAVTRQHASLSAAFGYEVSVPSRSFLEIANREANQNRFPHALAALDSAAQSYPRNATLKEWRAQIQSMALEASKAGRGPTANTIPFSPASADDVARPRGEWSARTIVEPGTSDDGEARFELRGDTLVLLEVAHHVAADGGDYRVLPAMVAVHGNSIWWERENRGGGHRVVTGRFVGVDRIEGEERVISARPMPAGFNPAKVRVILERRK